MHFKDTKFGFEWGNAKLSRGFSDDKRGWVTFLLETDKYKGNKALQVYVTKTGKVRVHDWTGEWNPSNKPDTTALRKALKCAIDNIEGIMSGTDIPSVVTRDMGRAALALRSERKKKDTGAECGNIDPAEHG